MSLIFITFVVFSVTGLPSCFSADQRYEKCLSSLRCGSQSMLFPNITYPFWGNDINKPDYCGQSPFKLSCKDNQTLTLEINNQTLRVLSTNLENNTITVADESLFDVGCPTIFNFTRNIHFTLGNSTSMIDLYVCSNTKRSLSMLSCNIINDSRKTYHVFGPLSNPSQDCVKTGDIPMLQSSKNDLQQSSKELRTALEQGFDLKYDIESQTCQTCTKSQGICGSESGSQNFRCLCEDRPHNVSCNDDPGRGVRAYAKTAIIFGCGFFGAILIAGCLFCFTRRRKRETSQNTRHHNLDALIEIKQYSYAEVKKITKSFSETVGKGGFGNVYGGNLRDGRKVAVKILKDLKSNGEDFINEVASMSQTSHVNIVSLLGFCYEGSKRAIVYEFLENGSLDQFISKKNSLNLDVNTLYRIALGVARGLEYLHHGCKTRIVHFDIKPQNVLLDDTFCPKVSDFGLAKLCEKRESILSLLDTRGTIGYIAPEVFSGMYGRISHKSDVYSYGMLVLEMIGARDNKRVETNGSNSSSSYFPDWIYKDLENGDHILKHCDEITREEKEIAKKMTLVGLWCIQPCPSNRPPMNKVVEMMEGSLDALQVPPKPSLNISTLSFPESSSLSEENSNNNDPNVEI